MTNGRRNRILTLMVPAAILAVGAASAHAAGDSWFARGLLERGQEARIRIGMSEAQVRQALGRPGQIEHYRNQPGATWTYELAGSPLRFEYVKPVLDVDFDRDGRVTSFGERELPEI